MIKIVANIRNLKKWKHCIKISIWCLQNIEDEIIMLELWMIKRRKKQLLIVLGELNWSKLCFHLKRRMIDGKLESWLVKILFCIIVSCVYVIPFSFPSVASSSCGPVIVAVIDSPRIVGDLVVCCWLSIILIIVVRSSRFLPLCVLYDCLWISLILIWLLYLE